MPGEQILLFVAVAALALALVLVVVLPRMKPSAGQNPALFVESAPEAATDPGVLSTPSASASALPPAIPSREFTMLCPTCRRQFAAGLRFCPYDARLLTRDLHPGRLEPEILSSAIPEKICPSCARRYEALATVCGRDGAALVSVN